jgi:hypothetical protein
MSMMDEFDHLCDRFGEENVCCRNCENWRPVVYGDALPQTFWPLHDEVFRNRRPR